MTSKLQSPFGDQGWFSNRTELLFEQIKNTITNKEPTKTRAVIAPHAGYRWCGDVLGSVMRHVDDSYTRVVIIGPSHRVRFNNTFVGCDYDCVATPLGDCEVERVSNDCIIIDNKIHYNEHSIQLHVPYVQYCCPSAAIIPLIVSEIDRDRLQTLVDCVRSLIDDQTLIMISSDFTHYGSRFNYTPYDYNIKSSIENYDKRVIEHIVNNDVDSYEKDTDNKNTICGRTAIRLLLHMLKNEKTTGRLCKYNMSGNMTNDYTNTVSYAGIHIS